MKDSIIEVLKGAVAWVHLSDYLKEPIVQASLDDTTEEVKAEGKTKKKKKSKKVPALKLDAMADMDLDMDEDDAS